MKKLYMILQHNDYSTQPNIICHVFAENEEKACSKASFSIGKTIKVNDPYIEVKLITMLIE